YAMHRGRWCMIQGFREPHMTGDCTLAKSVALSIFIVAVGGAIVKYAVPIRPEFTDGEAFVLLPDYYVRGTFGLWGVVGGFIFGLGGMLAGGCGSGTLWRVGEGQIKLWIVVPFFAVANSLMTKWFRSAGFEDEGVLGQFIYLPEYEIDLFGWAPGPLGYGGTLGMIALIMALWYVIVTWNEDSNKLIVPM
ncbi:MAG: YeeE/YedE family protein, partial [Candidatus Electrothrix sp. AR3]|nr:YeeE/YedE family protein [Candidatus Electrothrix sp. AR3]